MSYVEWRGARFRTIYRSLPLQRSRARPTLRRMSPLEPHPSPEPPMEVDTEEVSKVAKVAAWVAVAICTVAFLFVAFWSFLSLFWLAIFLVPAAYYYFRSPPAAEAEAELQAQPDAPKALAPDETLIEMSGPDEVTEKLVGTAEARLVSEIKAAADAHEWERVADLAVAASRR